MNRRKLYIFCFSFFCLYIGSLYSQQTNTGILSQGEIPSDFFRYRSALYENSKEKALFTSGLLLYGTELNNYVNSILAQLLKDKPTLKQAVKVYLYRSYNPNVYTNSDSIIIINIGLLSKIQNESQLAFILSHELAHICLDHNLLSDDFSRKEKYQHSDIFNKEHFRSEEDELEADQYGYEHFFLPNGFNANDLMDIFLLFESEWFPITQTFHFSDFISKQTILIESLKSIEKMHFDSNEPIEMSGFTQSRIEKFTQIKQSVQQESTAVSNTEFEHFHKIAIEETLKLYISFHEYSNALYFSSFLLTQYPEDPFLKIAWAASNYGVLRTKESNQDFKFDEDSKYTPAKSEIHFFYNEISSKELETYVVNVVTDLSLQYPDNSYILRLKQNLNDLKVDPIESFQTNVFFIFHPTYNKVNKNKESIKNLNQELIDKLFLIADKTNIPIQVYHSDSIPFITSREYNQLEQFQLLQYSVLSFTDNHFVYFPVVQEDLSKQYPYLNFIDIQYRSVPDRFITRFYYLPLILFNPSSLPITTAHVFANRKKMSIHFVVLETQTNTIKYKMNQTISDFNGKAILKQFLFDQYKQILKP